MRIRYAAPGIGLLVLGCVAVFGADSWREKAPADWTADEVKKILNDSPWSQQVRMEMGEPGGAGMLVTRSDAEEEVEGHVGDVVVFLDQDLHPVLECFGVDVGGLSPGEGRQAEAC